MQRARRVVPPTEQAPAEDTAEPTEEESSPDDNSTADTEGDSGGDVAEDVVVDSCEAGDFGDVTAGLTITNSTEENQSYIVTVSANGPDGNRVAELSAAANQIAPGQSASVDAVGFLEDAPEDLTCVVASVDRFSL